MISSLTYQLLVPNKYTAYATVLFLIKFRKVNNKAKPEDLNQYFKQEYLEKMEFISKMYRGDEIKSDTYNKYLSDSEYN